MQIQNTDRVQFTARLSRLTCMVGTRMPSCRKQERIWKKEIMWNCWKTSLAGWKLHCKISRRLLRQMTKQERSSTRQSTVRRVAHLRSRRSFCRMRPSILPRQQHHQVLWNLPCYVWQLGSNSVGVTVSWEASSCSKMGGKNKNEKG